MNYKILALLTAVAGLFTNEIVHADNPLVTHIYTADPSARVFNDTLYVFPSHDIAETENAPGYNGFRMEDYHVFSTTDLINYTDHGVILKDEDLDWVSNTKDAMWAPDCNVKNGKYYFYFPGDFKIGVATADHPTGPYTPMQQSIKNANQIDPNIFIDDDGTPYLYFGGGDYLNVMRLKDDMFTPDMEPQKIENLQVDNYKEGSWMFKHNGIYYFTYPVDLGGGEQIHYATGNNPLGPFTPQGTIMDNWTDGCWTNHHSILEYKGQWYIFYHHKDISGDQSLRSMCADSLFFNSDGSIKKVPPTYRGIGVRKATDDIQMDRYSEKHNVSIALLDDLEPLGWKVEQIKNNGWIKYNTVDFGTETYSKVLARVAGTSEGGQIEIRLGSNTGQLISSIDVPNTGDLSGWTTVSAAIQVQPTDTNDLVCVFKTGTDNSVVLNWVKFIPENSIIISKEGHGNGIIKYNETIVCGDEVMTCVLSYSAAETYNFSVDSIDYNRFLGWKVNGEEVTAISNVKAGDEIIAMFRYEAPPRPASSTLEAEDFDEQEGIQTEGCSEGGKNIGYIQNGDYIKFEDIDFGIGVKEMLIRVASDTDGGKVNLYVDSKSGTPHASISFSGTGGWQVWKTETKAIKQIEGIHDIYLEFTGGSGYLFNLNWVTFNAIVLSDAKILNDESNKLMVYPNPVNISEGWMNIEYSGLNSTSFQITNLHGQRVLNGDLNPGRNEINLSLFKANTIYIVSADQGQSKQVIQMIL